MSMRSVDERPKADYRLSLCSVPVRVMNHVLRSSPFYNNRPPPRITTKAINTTTILEKVTPRAAPLFSPPLDVEAVNLRSFPLLPLLVASTLGSMVAVFLVFVTAVVENVCAACVDAPSLMIGSSPFRKTKAKPGAGTRTLQLFAPVSQATLVTLSSPLNRPSDSN
jgi:hypothetical protein